MTLPRLASALVTESLVAATYSDVDGRKMATLSLNGTDLTKIPLIAKPILSGIDIKLLDPLDIDSSYTDADLVRVWTQFSSLSGLSEESSASILLELVNASEWFARDTKDGRAFPTLSSQAIAWEQSVAGGHPTHPMHKTRASLPPLRLDPSYNLLHPRLRLIHVPITSVLVTGPYHDLVIPFISRFPVHTYPDGYIPVPVHELQIAHIAANFPEAVIHPPAISYPVEAQQSLRSIIVPGLNNGFHLKLPLGIKLTSAVRTISPASAYLGPRFSAQIIPKLTYDRTILTVAEEPVSLIGTHPDPLVARHLACLIRQDHTANSRTIDIVCTALVDTSSPQAIFGLTTKESRVAWLSAYIDILLRAFLPPLLINGVAFECHPQNAVARFSSEAPHKLVAFVVRDFGGLKIHPATLLASIPEADLSFVHPTHSILAETIDAVWTRMYHTVVHNHLQQLIRVIGLHTGGEGYELLRMHLAKFVPLTHSWFTQPYVEGKCFMRMRMQGMDRWHLHGPFPNLILFRGEELGIVMEQRDEQYTEDTDKQVTSLGQSLSWVKVA
ncbi:IucC family-domain-containing protein [Armillaria luteobubalina]|uniref:IucC family-domain-containing protein n=1 Tax=Armillaria luteobubalina TaxID=153913 RepID=A0AA39Q3L4_9AGAR|nr:IucC family-domain-containing protein [Armillaria luteobubalina]